MKGDRITPKRLAEIRRWIEGGAYGEFPERVGDLLTELERHEEIGKVASFRVDASGELWVHLDAGHGAVAVAINLNGDRHGPIVDRGVAAAAEALAKLGAR